MNSIYTAICDAIASSSAGRRTFMNLFDAASEDEINQFYIDCVSQDEFKRIQAVAIENDYTIPVYTGA